MDYNNLDMGVVNLARAIRQKESGGGTRTVSKLSKEEGSVGGFQYLKPTFEKQAKLLGGRDLNGNPLDINNSDHQNLVFYTWAKNLKDQGYGVDQIAAAHNGGEGRLKGYANAKGVNKFGNKYDVPAYAADVVDMYNKLKASDMGGYQQPMEQTPQEPAEPTIDELRAERMAQGLPVAVNKNKVEPSFFSNIVRSTVKPFASVGVGAKKAAFSLGGAIAGNDEALLKNDPTKAVKSKFLGDIYPLAYDQEGLNVKKGVGQLAEIASVGVGGGTVGGLGQVAKTGFKEGAKQALRASVPLIKEGAISGALGGFGTSLQNDENLGGVIRDTAIGAGIGAVATPVLSGATAVLGKGAGKVAGRFAPDAQNLRYRAQELDELVKVENNYQKLRKNQTFNKNIDKIREQALDSGVLAGAVDETGTIKTADAIKKYRSMTLNDTENVVRDNLAISGEVANINDVQDYLLNKVMKSGMEGKQLETARNNVLSEINGYLLRADESGNIPLTVLHDAKVGSYDLIDFNTPADVKKYQKTLAQGLKELVENNSKTFDVKEANKSLSEPLAVVKYLEDLDGRKVRGGKLGKYAAQISGNIVGGAAGSVFGPFGSAVGTVIGGEVAGAIKGNTLSNSLGRYTGKAVPKSKVLEKAVARTAPLRAAKELEKSYSNSLGNLNTIYPNMITKNKNVIPKVSTEIPKKASPKLNRGDVLQEYNRETTKASIKKLANEINFQKEYIKGELDNHPGKKLVKFIGKEGELMEPTTRLSYYKEGTQNYNTIKESNRKMNNILEKVAEDYPHIVSKFNGGFDENMELANFLVDDYRNKSKQLIDLKEVTKKK